MTAIIIPTLNERANIEQLILAILKEIPDVSILVVDDNSSDGTGDAVRNLHDHGLSHAHLLKRTGPRGYGRSVIDGLRWAHEGGFDTVITMDADFSHDYHAIPGMISQMASCDVSIGSRYIPGGGVENWHWQRRLLSKFSNWYVREILGIGFHDATTGFVCYSRDAVEKLIQKATQSEGYAFLVVSKYILANLGFQINEYPITFHERREGKSKMSFKNIWEAIWLPWRLRFKRG